MRQANVELVLRGYWAFVAGDLDTVAEMLDPDIEWISVDPGGSADHENVLDILADRFEEGYRIEIERCVGIGEEVAVSFRVAGEELDASDDRPLQTRRYFTVGRYSAVVTVRNGRVVRVQEYPHLAAALEALGLEAEAQIEEGARWWEVRRAHSRKPATYRCPFCGRLLHAMSEHVLIAPEGDASRRRHAHADCVARARAAGTFRTLDDWRAAQGRGTGRWLRLPWRRPRSTE